MLNRRKGKTKGQKQGLDVCDSNVRTTEVDRIHIQKSQTQTITSTCTEENKVTAKERQSWTVDDGMKVTFSDES